MWEIRAVGQQCAKPSTRGFGLSRLGWLPVVLVLGAAAMARPVGAQVRVGVGFRVEIVATGIARPIQLALSPAGDLVVLSHGSTDAVAAEVFSLDLARPVPIDAARAPRIVVPFAREARKTAFGSLALAPGSGDVYLGEENGNRIYRLTPEPRLVPVAVGLRHLVGGSSIAFDAQGRLLALDFASPETALRAETPPPPEFDWLAGEAYVGPVVFRVEVGEGTPLPRRLDLLPPLYPRGGRPGAAGEPLSRIIALVAPPGDATLLVDSLGQVFRLGPDGLRRVARLPAGHYHRTSLAVAPDGGLLVSTGLHVRTLYRVAPDGAVSVVAGELGDPNGVIVDRTGAIYVAETALHRIVRIVPVTPPPASRR
jgi:hypothetical protein